MLIYCRLTDRYKGESALYCVSRKMPCLLAFVNVCVRGNMALYYWLGLDLDCFCCVVEREIDEDGGRAGVQEIYLLVNSS